MRIRFALTAFVIGAFLVHGTWAVYSQTAKPAGPLQTKQVKGDLHVISGEGGNVALLATGEGVLLVDNMLRIMDGARRAAHRVRRRRAVCSTNRLTR
jgi:hypothetical protein